jgi:hypothetical protein
LASSAENMGMLTIVTGVFNSQGDDALPDLCLVCHLAFHWYQQVVLQNIGTFRHKHHLAQYCNMCIPW